ncbi:hypothetical protein BJ138DRAFT_1139031 [Hygrophoropsis aurantiaca]|uniref:Uncharacterized protein n=1 Tax=Hygrophoropsis aurantiaca TaxID=72124 RepID=A0ACB8AUS2_9AGAM|nr:hypothetical protein BJ138DRAFT_1139031 [Hygrophoropsis aurantiaca]
MMSQQQPQPPPAVMPPNMLPQADQADLAQANSYYPQEPADLSGGLPINLDSLRDGPPGSKPFYPYSTLIRYAIKGSPNQKLLLEDIYYAIESRFPYFRTAPSGWKNSVRHNLSLNPCFEKVPRPLTDRGKGSYWTVNDNVDPRTGVHRVRKKKPKGSKHNRNSEEELDVDYHPAEAYNDPHAQFVPPPMHPEEAGPSRQAPYPPPYSYDQSFQMIAPHPGVRFPISPGVPMGNFEMDEHGGIDWKMTWIKEITHLQQMTAEPEKAGIDDEWYQMMLMRVRGQVIHPFHDSMHPPGMPPHPPSNPGELQQ